MNELQAAQERIAKLEQDLVAEKQRSRQFESIVLSFIDDSPPATQEDFEETIRNPSKVSLDDLIREFELKLNA